MCFAGAFAGSGGVTFDGAFNGAFDDGAFNGAFDGAFGFSRGGLCERARRARGSTYSWPSSSSSSSDSDSESSLGVGERSARDVEPRLLVGAFDERLPSGRAPAK